MSGYDLLFFSFDISCQTGLMVVNSFKLCLSEELFTSPSILIDNFSGKIDIPYCSFLILALCIAHATSSGL